MKRCPQCNRVETDEALRFCRVDGATLVSDSSSIDEAGTIKLGSGHVTGEAATGKLPPMTDANINRATAATSVLPPQPVGSRFADFRITAKTRVTWRGLTLIGAAIVIMVAAVIIISYRTRSNSAPIQSIAVMPFVNASGNADNEYLSDGMTETLIRSLSQLPNLNVKARRPLRRIACLAGEGSRNRSHIERHQLLKGVCLAVSGRRDEAIQQFKKMQEMDPTFPWVHSFLARIYVWTGNHNAAVEEHSKSVELDGHPDNAKLLRDSFTTGGWDAFWRESVRLRQGLGLGSMIRLAAANESEKEVAVKRLLEQAEKGGFWVFLIKTDPLYDPLRSDSRFQELLKKFNPPQ